MPTPPRSPFELSRTPAPPTLSHTVAFMDPAAEPCPASPWPHSCAALADARIAWQRTWQEVQLSIEKQQKAQERLLVQLALPNASNAEVAEAVAQLRVADTVAASWKAASRPADCAHAPTPLAEGDLPEAVPSSAATAPTVDDTVLKGDTAAEGSPAPADAAVRPDALAQQRRALKRKKMKSGDLMNLEALRQRAQNRPGLYAKVQAWALDSLVKWSSMEETIPDNVLSRFLFSPFWETLVAAMIASNSLLMGFSSDYALEHAMDGQRSTIIDTLEIGFLVFFVVELFLRLLLHRQYFFYNADMWWNLFDLFIVMISAWDVVDIITFQSAREGNLTFMRSVRLLRLMRTLRVLRLFKFASSLRRMLQSLTGSIMDLFWSLSLMCFMFYIFAIATVQGVTNYIALDGDLNPELTAELNIHFGSVTTTILTYYMATSGGNDWSTYYEPLRQASGLTAGLFVFVVAFTQIALLNIMTGVFVENAMKLAQPDRATLALEQRKCDMRDAQDLRETLEAVCPNFSGMIGWDQFQKIASDVVVSSTLESMGLGIHDAHLLFEMLCKVSDSTEVDFQFMVDAFLKMKGPAANLDLQALIYKTDILASQVNAIARNQLSDRVEV